MLRHTLYGLQAAMAWRMQLGADIGSVSVIGNPVERQGRLSLSAKKIKRLLKRCAATSSELWEGRPIGDFTFGRVDQGQPMSTYFSHTIVQPTCVIYNSSKPVPTQAHAYPPVHDPISLLL